jgi:hypothetical protein
VLADLESAPIEEPLGPTLRMLGQLTAEGKLSVEDMRKVLADGVSSQQVEDALSSAPRSIPPIGSPTLSASRCSIPMASRREPSTCLSAVTDSA